MEYLPISDEENRWGSIIVQSAFQVHKNLGPGLLERVYETCLCHEIARQGCRFERQVAVPVLYDGLVFDEGFRIDVLVERRVVVEIKAVTELHEVFRAQLLTYLKLTRLRLGFLINFHTTLIKDAIHRVVL